MLCKNRKFITGFTIAELLIALAITGMLLVAVAAAFNASIKNYRENEDLFKTLNNARQALIRMTTQMRTGTNFDTGEPNNKCSFDTAESNSITYEYRIADSNLYLITNSDGKEYVLCENVTAVDFGKNLTDDLTDVKSVQISITVASGGAQRTASAAVVVRRNL